MVQVQGNKIHFSPSAEYANSLDKVCGILRSFYYALKSFVIRVFFILICKKHRRITKNYREHVVEIVGNACR